MGDIDGLQIEPFILPSESRLVVNIYKPPIKHQETLTRTVSL